MTTDKPLTAGEPTKPWARLRKHGPAMIFGWYATEAEARAGCTQAFHHVAYFPDEDALPDQAGRGKRE